MEIKTKPPAKIEPSPQSAAVVLTYADLMDLGSILGSNISIATPYLAKTELFNRIRELTTISVEGVPITLEPRLLMRLKSHCLDKPNFDKWLKEVVVKQLHDYAGW
jgi:hypothetical protein